MDKTLSPAALKAGWLWLALQFTLLPRLVGLLGLDDGASNLLFHTISTLAVVVIFWQTLEENLRRETGRRFWMVCIQALTGYYAAGQLISLLIWQLAPEFLNRNDQVLLSMKEQWPILILTTVVLAPVNEECLFRGLIFSRLRQRSRFWGYCLSSLLFGLIHVLGYLGQYTPVEFALALLQYLPAGLILAWAQERTQTLTAPILIHATINAVSLTQIR